MEFSIRTRTRKLRSAGIWCAVIATLFVGSVSCGSAGHRAPVEGHALSAAGPLNASSVLLDGKLGDEYVFAFPPIFNNSDKPVTLLGVHLARPAAQVTVLKYRLVNYFKTGRNYITSSRVGDKPASGDLSKFQNFELGKHVVLKARQQSPWYAIVYVRAVRLPFRLRGCVLDYRTGAHRFSQKLPCEFGVDR